METLNFSILFCLHFKEFFIQFIKLINTVVYMNIINIFICKLLTTEFILQMIYTLQNVKPIKMKILAMPMSPRTYHASFGNVDNIQVSAFL